MNRDPNQIKVTGAAFRLHRDYGISNPSDLCVQDIAMAEGLYVTVGKLSGADGRLVRKKDRGVARISSSITDPNRRRFTTAHEFGHWMLHRNDSQFFLCTENDMYKDDYRSHPLETEANSFAAEFLMPKFWITDSFLKLEPSIAKLQVMADWFQVSLTAAALRYVELSKQKCMIVFSDGKHVKWWRKNKSLPFWLTGNQEINILSHASECYQKGHICDGMDTVDPDGWFYHCDRQISELLEDSIYLPGSGILVSLLWFPGWG